MALGLLRVKPIDLPKSLFTLGHIHPLILLSTLPQLSGHAMLRALFYGRGQQVKRSQPENLHLGREEQCSQRQSLCGPRRADGALGSCDVPALAGWELRTRVRPGVDVGVTSQLWPVVAVVRFRKRLGRCCPPSAVGRKKVWTAMIFPVTVLTKTWKWGPVGMLLPRSCRCPMRFASLCDTADPKSRASGGSVPLAP